MKIDALLRNRTVKNAGYLIVGKIVQMVFSLFVGLLTARYLGPADYGLIGYAGAYTAFFASVCTLGINSVLVKELVDRPGEEGSVIGTALGLRAASSLLSAAVIICISCFVDAGETVTLWVVALSALGMVFHIAEVFSFWFQSRLESKVTAAAALAAYIASSAYKILLLATGRSVEYFAAASAVDYLCLGALLLWQYRKRRGGKLKFSWKYGRELLGRSCHFILPGLMVSVYGQTDKLMLKQMAGQADVGHYAMAASLCGMWCFVLTAVIDSVCPSVMEAAKRNDERLFEDRNVQLYAIVFYISAFVSLFFTAFAQPVIRILYGESYLPAAAPLRILTWHTAFSYLGVARNAWIVARNRQRHLLKIYIAAAVINVLLNRILIPVWGTSGAAAASLIAQIITTLVMPFFICELRPNAELMLRAMHPETVIRMLRKEK